MSEYRLTDKGRAGLRALLEAETLQDMAPYGWSTPALDASLELPEGWFEPVPPPRPPEPEPGLWQVGAVTAYRRPEADRFSSHHWSILGPTLSGSAFIGWYQWEAVVAKAGDDLSIRRMAPVPEPVELPWTNEATTVDTHRLHRTASLGVRVTVEEHYTTIIYEPSAARSLAAALLSAADEAERDRG